MLDPLGELTEGLVAWSELTPSVADTNDGAAVKAIGGQALALHPAAMNEIVFAGTSKPMLGTAKLVFGVGHGVSGSCCVSWF
jgi:hypothetical protein